MTRYLLDTSVLSALAPDRPPPVQFVEWLAGTGDGLYLSVVTIAEVKAGIDKLEIRDGRSRRVKVLSDWLAATVTLFGARLIALDAALALAVGRMSAHVAAIGRHPGFPDVVIAATARERGLILLTRNTRHFAPFGIDVVDPFEALP